MTEPADRNERDTAKPVRIPTVLAVACSDALLARCWGCVAGMGVMVRDCEIDLAATLAAARQPLVIVVARAVYELDPDELDALARDVGAVLLPVEDDVDEHALEAALVSAVRTGARQRDGRRISGRYSIVPGEMAALPASIAPTSEPPPTSAVHLTPLVLDPLEDGDLFGEDLFATLR